MTILEHLERRSIEASKEDAAFFRSLADLGNYVSTQADAHLKQVIAQHPGFDLHDSSHSASVNKNIQSLLGEVGLRTRSVPELFLLHLASYLHDCAMALPQWELNLFQITEGTLSKNFVSKSGFKNDLKPVLGFDAASRLITAEKLAIFGGSKLPMDWLFSPSTEQELVSDLAERLRDYQGFRNGYASELRELQSDDVAYAQRSQELRQEFIRQTHSTRIENWVRNLETLFEQRLSGAWGKALSHDLALICRSHGEGEDFVRGLQTAATYFGGAQSNLQLLAFLLRIADIVDFSTARAPSILLREKLITSAVSRDHWDVKNEGISYSFDKTAAGSTVVRYSAYFQNPKLYFLFQGYLDWVDSELILYNQIVGPKKSHIETLPELPPIESRADRSGIRFDSKRFTPGFGLQFSLDQRRILELLMGVKLYKEPFACIRELYQNSLDATRCMLAAEGDTSLGRIQFGLQTDASGTYLSCRDNGVGMTKEIVSRFLLKIGNSYYRSKDFQRLSASWNDAFTPVSQFGVGILSCFMIGTRMEIISKPLPGLHDDAEPICFVIDGPHEHFYYKPVESSDRESIGRNGTIVKLFLSEKYSKKIHASPLTNIAFWQHAAGSLRHYPPLKAELDAWESHLYHTISGFIGDYPEKVNVSVKFSNGNSTQLIKATTPFDFRTLKIPRELIETWENERYRYRRDLPQYLSVIDHVAYKVISANYLGATFTTIVGFPKCEFPINDHRVLDVVSFVDEGPPLLVDGIRIGNNSHTGRKAIDSLSRVGILNFSGRQRPPLSVDRLSVIEWPEELSQIAEALADQIATALLKEVIEHTKTYKLAPDSKEIRLLWDFLFIRFGFLAEKLIDGIIKMPDANYVDAELSSIIGHDISLSSVATATELIVSWPQFRNLKERSRQMLSAKLAATEKLLVVDSKIFLQGGGILPLSNDNVWDLPRDWTHVYRADEWQGSFGEFDLASMVWPVLPARLYDRIDSDEIETEQINNRTKLIHHYSNGISAIGDLDPSTIHQRLGIYRVKRDSFFDEKPASLIYRFDETANNFWLLELGRHHKPEDKKRWVLYAYIGPRELSAQENGDLSKYRVDDPDYARGVVEGWSILFLGQKDVNVICLPGIASRKRLAEEVPESFWRTHADLTFHYLDGERLYRGDESNILTP